MLRKYPSCCTLHRTLLFGDTTSSYNNGSIKTQQVTQPSKLDIGRPSSIFAKKKTKGEGPIWATRWAQNQIISVQVRGKGLQLLCKINPRLLNCSAGRWNHSTLQNANPIFNPKKKNFFFYILLIKGYSITKFLRPFIQFCGRWLLWENDDLWHCRQDLRKNKGDFIGRYTWWLGALVLV